MTKKILIGLTSLNNQRVTKRIISMLLAALVVLCPLKCLMAGCHSCSSLPLKRAAPGCCSCFDDPCNRPSTPEKDKSIPDHPDDCTCINCFCGGALKVSNVPIDFPDSESELLFETICWSDVEERVPLFPQIPPTGFFLCRLAGGAELRAALSCWIL